MISVWQLPIDWTAVKLGAERRIADGAMREGWLVGVPNSMIPHLLNFPVGLLGNVTFNRFLKLMNQNSVPFALWCGTRWSLHQNEKYLTAEENDYWTAQPLTVLD